MACIKSQAARLSSWAIVLCTAPDNQIDHYTQSFHTSRIIPPCFRVIALAQTRGEQTVARAELQALVVALELRPDATTVTDCQSNIDLWISTTGGLGTISLSTKANADLIARLAQIPRPPTQRAK